MIRGALLKQNPLSSTSVCMRACACARQRLEEDKQKEKNAAWQTETGRDGGTSQERPSCCDQHTYSVCSVRAAVCCVCSDALYNKTVD